MQLALTLFCLIALQLGLYVDVLINAHDQLVLLLPGPLFTQQHQAESVSASWSVYPYHMLIQEQPVLYDELTEAADTSALNDAVPINASPSHAINTARQAWDASLVLAAFIDNLNRPNSSLSACDTNSNTNIDVQEEKEDQHQWCVTLRSDLYLSAAPTDDHRRILELGAGRHAVVSISMWLICLALQQLSTTSEQQSRQMTIYASDVAQVQPYISRNMQINREHQQQRQRQTAAINGNEENEACDMSIIVVDWTDEEVSPSLLHPPLSLLLASDIIWLQELIPPLVHLLGQLIPPHSSTPLYIAHQQRSLAAWEQFRSQMEHAGFTVQLVPRYWYSPVYQHPSIHIYRIARTVNRAK